MGKENISAHAVQPTIILRPVTTDSLGRNSKYFPLKGV